MSELQKLIEEQKIASFRPEYRDTASDAEALGILISHHFEWDGIQILETAVAALEDANYHTEAGQISDILESAKNA